MAKDKEQNFRKGPVTNRTHGKSPKTSDFTKRNETLGLPAKGKYFQTLASESLCLSGVDSTRLPGELGLPTISVLGSGN